MQKEDPDIKPEPYFDEPTGDTFEPDVNIKVEPEVEQESDLKPETGITVEEGKFNGKNNLFRFPPLSTYSLSNQKVHL